MKYILLIHTIVEILGGTMLIFYPAGMMLTETLSLNTLAVIKLFGVLVLSFGIVSYIIYRQFDFTEFDKKAVLVFMLYHFIQSLQCYAMYRQEIFQNAGALTVHLGLALCFFVAFMNERDKFPN